VGKYYFDNKRYKAALKRFTVLVTRYPDVGVHYEALLMINQCEQHLAERATVEE
jgi:outer membrane protein assembly factor BamD